MLDNPNFVYSIDNNITYYSHDKGFIIATIKNYKIITGHCLPFHVFKKNPLDYIEIFETADKKFNIIKRGLNYFEIFSLFLK